jgi:hypothetical protein
MTSLVVIDADGRPTTLPARFRELLEQAAAAERS